MAIFRVGNKSEEVNFPSIRPTLDLDFANTKTLDSRITFTRSSGGSYVGSDGLIKYAGVNQPRFDHDPITGESLGLLIEEQRTNLLTYSDTDGAIGSTPTAMGVAGLDFGQSAVVSTDVSVGSNGKSIKHTRGTDSDSNIGYRVATVTAGLTYIFSVYVYIPSSQAKNFAGKFINFKYEALGIGAFVAMANVKILDKWQRVSGTYTPLLNNSNWVMRTNANAGSYLYTDCWQLEVGKFPTSYIPTQASTRTRAADNILITDKNFSDFYNSSESTIFTEARGVNIIEDNRFTRRYWELYTDTGSRILSGYGNLNSTRLLSLNNFIESANIININQSPATKFIKNIASFKDNYFSTYSNGENNYEKNQIFGKLPAVTTIKIGSSVNNAFGTNLNGTIKRFIYWPKILSDGQLQALTK